MLGNITHIFQIPFKWFKAVDAKCFNFTPGHMLDVRENDQGGDVLYVDQKAFEKAVREVLNAGEGDNPTAVGSYPTDEVTQEAGTLWRAGGENGAEVMVAYKCVFDTDGQHKTYAAKLVLSADGRVLRIEKAENAGWMV